MQNIVLAYPYYTQEADVKLRQLQHTGELHYKVCEMIENSGNDIQHINDNLAIIHEHAGKWPFQRKESFY